MIEQRQADKKSVIFLPTEIGGSWEEKLIVTEVEKQKKTIVKSAGRMALSFLTHPLTYQVTDAGTTAILAFEHMLR